MREIVRTKVKEYMTNNISLLPSTITLNQVSLEHVEDIGTSILCTKWKVDYPGGSFAQAVVNNELRQSFNFADSVCRQALHFFVVMVSNVDMPVEIWKQKVLELEKEK